MQLHNFGDSAILGVGWGCGGGGEGRVGEYCNIFSGVFASVENEIYLRILHPFAQLFC